MKVFFTVLCFFLLFVSCGSSKKTASAMDIKQGISGYVKEVSGNQMPSPDAPQSEGKALQTTIYIYENTNISQVERTGTSPFYNSIRTKFIQSVESDKAGHFIIDLPAGQYSLFTKLDGKFYANSFDSKNNIAPVMVEENKLTEVNITVSAKATY